MSSLVFPFHDPNNIETPQLKKLLPILQKNFKKAFVSLTPQTIGANPEADTFFKSTDFFTVNPNAQNSAIGEHFLAGFKSAADNSDPDEVLQLCSSDRLCFALTKYNDSFLKDIAVSSPPVLFHRSAAAWATHPKIYFAAESLVTKAGEVLFGKTLDFCWCHFVLTAGLLKETYPKLTSTDLVVTAEIVYLLKDKITTQEVDWLSWEDPFILQKDDATYRSERETDPRELEKRMGYVKPQIDFLFKEYVKNRV